MTKPKTFTINAGRRFPGFSRFRIIFRNEVSFVYRVSQAAMYNYNLVVNDWHRIVGLSASSPLSSSCQLAFINNGYGLQCGFICWDNGRRSVQPVTRIVPGKAYHIRISRSNGGYTIIHTTEEGIVSRHTAPAKRARPWQFLLLPRLGGNFTLDNDLVVTLIK